MNHTTDEIITRLTDGGWFLCKRQNGSYYEKNLFTNTIREKKIPTASPAEKRESHLNSWNSTIAKSKDEIEKEDRKH